MTKWNKKSGSASKRDKKQGSAPKHDTPESVARVMRKEALKNTGKDPIFRVYRGWKFGLSYGPVPVPTREMWDKLEQVPGGIASVIKRFGLKVPEKLSYDEFEAHLQTAASKALDVMWTHEWIFSASLHPRGRSSVEEDWRFYGEMMAAMGAPDGSLVTPIETTDPNAVHYAIWNEVPRAPGSKELS